MEVRLLIEIDGDTHATSKGYDEARDDKLRKIGFTVLRFTNDDVMKNVDGVAETIILNAVRLGQDNKGVSR